MAASTPKFVPNVPEFMARPASIDGAVLDATFVTRSLPDIDNKTIVIGLLAVPREKAGPEKEAWHISDFLAIKTLVSGVQADPRFQVWLSQCDTEAIVKQNPSAYTHGPEHRVVSGAAVTLDNSNSGQPGFVNGQIPIVFEPNVETIQLRFLNEIGRKSVIAAEMGFQIVVVISGRTTLEQDVYLDDYDVAITSQQIRSVMVEGAQATVVTSSLTSAGWQINPSFNEDRAARAVKKPIDFLARQCGGIFSRTITEKILSWDSPFIDNAKFDPIKKDLESHPGPAMPDDEQCRARTELSNKTHALLTSRMLPDHYDHSFTFDAEKDTWTQLIGSRKNPEMLETYGKIWNKLGTLPPNSENVEDRLSFFGTAFGGNRQSQINHLKHLVQESFPAWPGYYTSTFGQNVRSEFRTFLSNPSPTDLDCHVIFSIVECRMTTMVLGDLLIRYAGLDLIWAQRCRDWDEQRYDRMIQKEEIIPAEAAASRAVMGRIVRSFPFFYIPPGRVLDSSKLHHQTPPRISRYLAIGLTLRYRKEGPDQESAIAKVLEIIQQLQDKQVELLLDDEDLRKKGVAWWKSIEHEVAEDVWESDQLAANFVPPPPELVTPNTALSENQESRFDTVAKQTPTKVNVRDNQMAGIEVQSPEQPATPSSKDGMPQDRSPVFEVAQGVSPEVKIESHDLKINTFANANAKIHEVGPDLASADALVPPHLRKVWKPKSTKPAEVKPADHIREKLEEEVSVRCIASPENDGVEEAQVDSPELNAAKPDFSHDETPKLKPATTTVPKVPEVDNSLPLTSEVQQDEG
ncbi:uncharacterized protein PG998_012484 [Apiospora kogelbergensis]|uniref:uncharacterized protein n=1 Tax=Apiospora kogelbergensis TaxID=1337665 RepID=UPI00312EB282